MAIPATGSHGCRRRIGRSPQQQLQLMLPLLFVLITCCKWPEVLYKLLDQQPLQSSSSSKRQQRAANTNITNTTIHTDENGDAGATLTALKIC